ncbi:MAG: STAS domain-containing protein [Phycisphaerae bacterium]
MASVTPLGDAPFEIDQVDGMTVYRLLTTSLMSPVELARITDELRGHTEEHQLKVAVLNMAAVSYCSSAGLGMIMELNKVLRRNGGTLVLCCVGAIEEILRITRMHKVLEIAPDEEAAVAKAARANAARTGRGK